MSSDIEYLKNYTPDKTYIHPSRHGSYVTIVAENEILIGEVEVTERSRIAIKAFYVDAKKNYNTFTITKLKFHNTYGWQEAGSLSVNKFDLCNMESFVSLISSLDLSDKKKNKIKLKNIKFDQFQTILNTSEGANLLQQLSESPGLEIDIYAVASKRKSLLEFKNNLSKSLTETDWQKFFEENSWIFGHGLNYVFLNKVSKKLETTTTGSSFDESGKIVDGFMRTRAEVSQYVFVEIKKSDTLLLKTSAYRKGCWSVSSELSDAVTQIQKTTFDFSRKRFKDQLKDDNGNDLGESTYVVQPKSFLIIGNARELVGNDDKVACFELYRRNISTPEILTFDELYFRARCIVENLSNSNNSLS